MSSIAGAKRVYERPKVSGVGLELASFPLEVLPAQVEAFTGLAAAALPAPIDFVAIPVLAAASAAIGTTRAIEAMTGHRELPCLFTGVVGGPGSKKSPTLQLATQPVMDYYTAAHAAYKQALSEKGTNGPEPAHPPQTMLTDGTSEAIAEALDGHPRGILYAQDELSGLLGTMNQYRGGRGADLQLWQGIYSATPIVVKRKGKAPLVVERPFVTVVGGIQPDTLSMLDTGRQDGFLDRFLLVYPDPLPHSRSTTELPENVIQGYARVIRSLYKLDFHDTTGGPRVLQLTPEARAAYESWLDRHYDAMNQDGFEAYLEGHYSKLAGICLRLALVLELLWDSNSSHVAEDSMERAVRLINYFKSHSLKIYAALGFTTMQEKLEQLYAWLSSKGNIAKVRDVIRSGTAGIKSADTARALLAELEVQGLGSLREETYASGQKGKVFELKR